MSNRQRRAGPEAMRDYARQKLAGHTRLARHEFIADVVAYARNNGGDELLAERTARYAWDSRWGQTVPQGIAPADDGQHAVPVPPGIVADLIAATAPPEPELPPIPGAQPTYSLKELLQRAEGETSPSLSPDNEQLVYEQALLALNKNVDAMADLKDWAASEGLTVEELARRIIAEHEARRSAATKNQGRR